MADDINLKKGLFGALTAYVIWGFLVLYWRLLPDATSFEIIAHRIVWTIPFLLFWLYLKGDLKRAKAFWFELVETKKVPLLIFATLFACTNWWINVIAAQNNHVLELGIGFFLTPLFSMFCGLFVFREKVNFLEILSLVLAIAGLGVMLVDYGNLPCYAIGVSLTWAIYGALKKYLRLSGTLSVLYETLFLLPVALCYLAYLKIQGHFAFSFFFDTQTTWALIGLGIVTLVPMIAFTVAAVNLPMTVLGICQYINPVLVLFVGVYILDEKVSVTELKALAFILPAVALFVFSRLRKSKCR